MSMGAMIGVGAVVLLAVALGAGWLLSSRRALEAPPQVASQPPAPKPAPEPVDQVPLDPADRVTMPPTHLLAEDDEDAETVMASSEDMARLVADLRDD